MGEKSDKKTIYDLNPFKVLLLVNSENKPDENGTIYIDNIDVESECCAYLYSKTYSVIFGNKKKETTQSKQRLSVIKICSCNKKIYRKYVGVAVKNFQERNIALSANACQQLMLNPRKQESYVCISKGWWFPFYWYHSNSATRISFRIGLISLLVGLIGVVLSIVSILL